MLRKALHAIAFALVPVGFAGAFAPVVPCVDCNVATMYNIALAEGTGNWMIWNPSNGEIRGWRVTCGYPPANVSAPASTRDRNAGQMEGTCTGTQVAVTQEFEDTALNLSSVYNLTGHTYKAAVSIPGDSWHVAGLPPGDVGSAHDYVTNANYRAQLNDRLDEYASDFAPGSPAVAPMQYILAHADAALGFGTGVTLVATVTYPDGTSLKIDIKLVGAPEYEQGSARDETGQGIPDANVQGDAGTWTYGSGDHVARDRLVGTMRQLGFWFPPNLPSNDSTVTCTWDSANNRLSCIVSN